MASAYDVMTALAAAVEYACYPNGTSSPSVTTRDIKVVTGWPLPQNLNASLEAGKAQVSVFALDVERNSTRYQTDWRETGRQTPTVTATAAANVLTLGGTASAGNVVAAMVDNSLYAYQLLSGDTLNTAAAALQALIVADFAGTTVSGAVITVPAVSQVKVALVAAPGTAIKNVRQTQRQFQVAIWAPTPADRATIAAAVEQWLATLSTDPDVLVSFLALPDGTAAHIKYMRAGINDEMAKVRVFRHDLCYVVDFSLTVTGSFMPFLLSTLNLQPGSTTVTVPGSVQLGIVQLGGSVPIALFKGPDVPAYNGPYRWLQTDKPLSDPTCLVINEVDGP